MATERRRRSKGSGTVYRKPSGFYGYQYTDPRDGKKHTEALHTKNRTEAQANAEAFAKTLQAKDTADVVVQIAQARELLTAKPLPWDKVWPAFAETKPTGSAGTLHNYRRALDELKAWCKGAHPEVEGLHHVTADIAEDFLRSVWNRGVSANRHNYIRGALLLVTSKLAKRYGLDNPWAETNRRDDPARGRQKRRALSAKQTTDLLALLDSPDAQVKWRPDMRLLFRLGLFAGMREMDAALLRWSDIDMDRCTIRYTPHKTRGKSITAEVPMVPEVAGEIVARWNHRDPAQNYILPDIAAEYQRKGKKGATTKAVEEEAVRLVHKVTGDGRRERQDGDPQRKRVRSPYGFHSCRHTFCSVLAQRGVPLAKLAAMTGDAPNTLQAYYVHVEGEHHELSGAFAPLLTNGNGSSAETPRAHLLALVAKMTDAQVEAVLRSIEG